VIEFFSIGTAIVPLDTELDLTKPTLTLPLNN
jgi:hypothetical protein